MFFGIRSLAPLGGLAFVLAAGCSTPIDPAASATAPSTSAPAEAGESAGETTGGAETPPTDPSVPAAGIGSSQLTLAGGVNHDVVLTDVAADAVRSDFLDVTDLTVTITSGDVQLTLYLYEIPAGTMAPFSLTGDLAAEHSLLFDVEYSDDQNLFTAGNDLAGVLTVTTFDLNETTFILDGTIMVAGQSLDAPEATNDTVLTGTFSYGGPVEAD